MILDDKSLLFLSLKWNDEEFNENKYLINNFLSLYYLYINIKRNIDSLDNDNFFNKFKNQITTILNEYSIKLLTIKPSKYQNEFIEIYEFLNDFEKILITLGRDYYREHAKHSNRVYYIGKMLYDKLNYNLLAENLNDSWFIMANTHDFCYILQDINEILEKTENKISKSLPTLSFVLNYSINIGEIYLSEKHNKIFKILSTYDKLDQREYLIYLEKADKKDHGLMSSLFVFDFLSNKKEYTIEKIKPIVRGIALHTLSNTYSEIDIKSNSLATLLIMCDEIQEWNRTYVDSDFKVHPNIILENVYIPDHEWLSERALLFSLDIEHFYDVNLSDPGVNNPIKAIPFFNHNNDDWDFGLTIYQDNSGGKKNIQNITIQMNTIINSHISNLREDSSHEDIFLEEINQNLNFNGNKAHWKVTFIAEKDNVTLYSNNIYLKYLFSLYMNRLVIQKEPERSTLEIKKEDEINFIIPKLEELEEGDIRDLNKVINMRINKKVQNLSRIKVNLDDYDYDKIIIIHEQERPEGNMRKIYPQ